MLVSNLAGAAPVLQRITQSDGWCAAEANPPLYLRGEELLVVEGRRALRSASWPVHAHGHAGRERHRLDDLEVQLAGKSPTSDEPTPEAAGWIMSRQSSTRLGRVSARSVPGTVMGDQVGLWVWAL